jgi:hypothetical protein
MLYLSKTIFVYRFYKILVIEPTTEVKAESIGAPSVKEIVENPEYKDVNGWSDIYFTAYAIISYFCVDHTAFRFHFIQNILHF